MTEVPLPLEDILTLASRLYDARETEFAERLLSRALAVAPADPEALHLSGIAAFHLGRREEGLEKLERAIATSGGKHLYFRNVSEMYRSFTRFDEALDAARRAVELEPKDPIGLHNLSVIHYHRLELDACIEACERAIALGARLPGSHFQMAEALLLRGDWERGWEEYQWRFDLPGNQPLMPPTAKPRWDGAPFHDGTLLLIADQGFGDVIQFARYLPWAFERCPDIAVACPPEMMPLLRQILPQARLFREWSECPDFRAFRALSGLPGLHGTRPDRMAGDVPYLRADPVRVAAWKDRIGHLLPTVSRRVGIVWAGRPTHNNDRWRSTTLNAFAPLAAVPGTGLVALQKGPAAGQVGHYFGRAPLINLGADIADFEDTMAILDCLDALVTVDTSIGHLAGAMGRRTMVLLARSPDWRWLLDRADTPWYPSHTLIRQTRTGVWEDVMAKAAALIAAQ